MPSLSLAALCSPWSASVVSCLSVSSAELNAYLSQQRKYFKDNSIE